MSISIVGDSRRRRGGSFISRETFTQSTATAYQILNHSIDQHVLGGGTATGIGVNVYRLTTTGAVNPAPSELDIKATEGEIHEVFMGASGEAKLSYIGTTGTGAWVFSATDDHMQFKFLNGKWHVTVKNGTTAATQ